MTKLVIKWAFSFPPHPTSASALPGENRTDKIFIKINKRRYKILSFRICGYQQPIDYKVWLLCSSMSI